MRAQTGCAASYAGPGAFVCYPNPATNPSDSDVPDTFHFSAQGNAVAGRLIRRYAVSLDGRRIYQNRLAVPVTRISIETNIRSPYNSGTHTLSLLIEGAGITEVEGLRFHPVANTRLCDSFSRLEARTCVPRGGTPLDWKLPAGGGVPTPASTYSQALIMYSQNLARVEADTADAFTLDATDNLYTATHGLTGIEIRKYLPDGSLRYDHVVPLCGSGFVSITGLVLDHAGYLWIAGNSTACLPLKGHAAVTTLSAPDRPHGFLLKLDVNQAADSALLYASWVSAEPNQLRALRVDTEGKVYVAGEIEENTGARPAGFVAVIDAANSIRVAYQTFANASINALALDGAGSIYITGRADEHGTPATLIGSLADNGRRVSYLARVAGPSAQEGRGIVPLANMRSAVLVVAASENANYLLEARTCKEGRAQIEAIRLQPGMAVESALQPALDTVAGLLAGATRFGGRADARRASVLVQIATECGSRQSR